MCVPWTAKTRRVARTATLLVGLWARWLVSGASAHDYWLEPSTPSPAKGEELVLHLEMGDRLKTDEERPLQKDRVVRFDLYGDRTARRDLLATGQENQLPAARVRLEGGSALAVMDRKPRPITMEPEKFNQYLQAEGLDAVIAQRARLGQTDAPGRENYTRYLKALVQDGGPNTAAANTLYKRRVGQRLEILLENDPGQLNLTGGELTVKVLLEGSPLAGTKVFACHRGPDDQPPYILTATTSVKGLAKFKLDQPGLWLARTVYMRPESAGPKADAPWESFWATYAFAAHSQVPAPPAPIIPAASPPR